MALKALKGEICNLPWIRSVTPQSDVRFPDLNPTSATGNLGWAYPVQSFSEFPITIGSLIQSSYLVQRKSRTGALTKVIVSRFGPRVAGNEPNEAT